MLTTTQALQANEQQDNQATEKCYGVVKAGMNDCATATSSCAGSSTKDNQADAFIFLPKGICERLVGGQLTAKK
ncbi:BufA1 family periplasmic bufferin-type metallophore [Legionella jordanis]